MRSAGVVVALLLGGVAHAGPGDAELAAARHTRELIESKLAARDVELGERVRALYKIERAGGAPPWLAGGERAELHRLEEAARRAILRDLEERRILAGELVAASAAEQRLAVAQVALRAVRSPLPRRGWQRPVPGRVTAHFGAYRDRSSGARLFRRGVELEARPGAPVAVPRPGRVRWTGALRGLGEAIIVEHQGDLVTILAGVDAAVESGAEVPAGGLVGRAGASRMYLEVRHAGEPVDPEPLLP